jgi:hypothetical protein
MRRVLGISDLPLAADYSFCSVLTAQLRLGDELRTMQGDAFFNEGSKRKCQGK